MNRTKKSIFTQSTRIAAIAILLCWSFTANADSTPKQINIATESWNLYTNADGSGLFLDITRAIYESRGIEIDVKFVPYKRALHLLQRQQADAMYGTYSAEKEGKDYLMTPRLPIDKERTVAIFNSASETEWQGQTSLRGAQLAWVRGYDYHDNLDVDVDDYSEVIDSQQGLTMLSAGRFDFFLDHSGALQDTIAKIGFDTSGYRIETVIEENVYMAFTDSGRGRDLARIFDEGMAALIDSGELQRIFARYEIAYPFKAGKSAALP